MGPRRFSKVSELAEKIGPKKTALAAVEKTPVLDPEALAKAEAEAKAAFDQEKLQEYLATEIAPKQEKAIQRRKELKADELEEAIAKSQQGREFSGYKNWAEGGPTTEELRRAALERFQRDKAEGVRDIDLSKLKAAGIGGVAIGAGMVASPLARADEGPTVSQSNPEFSSSSAPKPFVLPSFAEKALKTQAFLGKMEEEGKLAPDVTSYLYDTAYKYGIDPAKRKVMGLLTGKDVPEEETPSYSDIYKQGFENIGKENVGKFLKGFASAAAEDPTGTTQDLIQSAKDEDVADYVANTAAGVSELAEDPLAPFMAGVGKLPKTMRTLSKFRPK